MTTVTIDVPDALIDVATQLAAITGQSVESVLTTSLAQALPPLADLTSDEVRELAPLVRLSDGQLWEAAREFLPPETQAELSDLSARQGEVTFSVGDRARLGELLDLYDQLTLRKAQAYLLLARRGYQVPN